MPTGGEISDGIERRCDDCGVILRPPSTRQWRCPRCGNLGGALAGDSLERPLGIVRVVSYPFSALPVSGLAAVGIAFSSGHVLINGLGSGKGWAASTWLALLTAFGLLLGYLWYLIHWLQSRKRFIAASREREMLRAMPTVRALRDRVRGHVIELLTERDDLMSRKTDTRAAAAASRRDEASRSDFSGDLEHLDRELVVLSSRIVQLVLSHEELELLELLIMLDGLSACPLAPPAARQRLSELRARAARQRLGFDELTSRSGFVKAVRALGGTPASTLDDAEYASVDSTEMLLLRDKWENFDMALGRTEATVLQDGDRQPLQLASASPVPEDRQMHPYRGGQRSAPHRAEPVLLPVEMWLRAVEYRIDSVTRREPLRPITSEALRVRDGLRIASDESSSTSEPEDVACEAEMETAGALDAPRPREITSGRAAGSP